MVTTQKPDTSWTLLRDFLDQKRIQPGERLLLTIEDLKRILERQELPDSVNRVTSWDPVMGKSEKGLQGVLNTAQLLPVAFEWEGSPQTRPRLRWIILLKWGRGASE
jgi:hypothetical protein